ncbi:MAG TPA: hypothetical protein VE944_31520 [Nostoc sp.]|uniref:hypothetical protein n=1 Tax=Nostoc sp. TaxID=1180 RepID=UPI002D35EFD4|nr:hypothetical protein [Nostoc sp.]HYX18821.1 hypothetical protein [Nostoc sp.]
MRDVIFHAFNCKYKDIINAVDKIHDAGYGAILIPPPLYSDKNGDQWWQRYQPKDYSASGYYAIQFFSLPFPIKAVRFEDVPHSCRKCCIEFFYLIWEENKNLLT